MINITNRIFSRAKIFLKLCSTNPAAAGMLLKAFLRGSFYVIYYNIFKPRFKIKWPFFVYENFSISGPGTVFIDESCSIFPNTFKGVSIVTLSPRAAVRIGKNASLGGLTIRCLGRVEIGDRALTGNSLIQDSLFSERPSPTVPIYRESWPAAHNVKVGNNVWIGSQCCVLAGTVIDDHSVVSLGSVCTNAKINKYHLASGNPSDRTVPITRLLQFHNLSR
jgi:acetyltransferase-like isoleucine patch superfamily enzyme